MICPCCFSRTLCDRGGFEICEVCYWEDDGQDDADADIVRGGPNGDLSLTAARANYATQRACDWLHSASVRRPQSSELTERSPKIVAAPVGNSEATVYQFMNCNNQEPLGSIEITSPLNAPDSWNKRLAVLSACKAQRSGAGELLNMADLRKADLRDVDLSAGIGRVDLSHSALDEADLSLAVLHRVKMTGTSLRKANLNAVLMTDAILAYARFDSANLSGSRLIGTRFSNAYLRDTNLSRAIANNADFSGADLSGANMSFGSFEGCCFDGAMLAGANIEMAYFCGSTFKGAIIRGLDFGSANWSGAIIEGAIIDPTDYADVPTIPNIHKTIYAAANTPGALDMLTWHSCDTTHCRAGWAVTLAGQAGAALEDKIGTAAAAALIYLASDSDLERIPDFHASEEEAMFDMRRLAELPTI
jgi:uncharacterized protein YjbI with pentapeptide repeats